MWKRGGKKPAPQPVGPPSREARTAAKWWADQLQELAKHLSPLKEEDYVKAASTGLDRIGAPVNYRMSREALKALTASNIKKFEASLAIAIQAELEVLSFSCFWSQRDQYNIENLFAPHLEAAGIPTEIGVTQPIFHHSMVTVIDPGKVVAHGGITEANVVKNKVLTLLP